MSGAPRYDAVVIGAGPAGLATSQRLQARGIAHVVFERGTIGECWSRIYDSLTLHTGKHLSSLPGLRFPLSAPLYLSKEDFLEYLQQYRETFALPIQTQRNVGAVTRDDQGWRISTSGGEVRAAAVVVATGIMSNPVIPEIEGIAGYRGNVRHSVTYRQPGECTGKRVLVVGAGNSAGEIASELGRAGVDTTVAIRSGANVVPLQVLGIPIQYWAVLVTKLPRKAQEVITAAIRKATGPPVIPRPPHNALDAIPMIGFRLVDAIRDGKVALRGGIRRFTEDGVEFSDGERKSFDEIILATGFRAALQFIEPLVHLDEKGFAARRDRVVSVDQPALFFVGHNYDSSGSLRNIHKDSALAAKAVKNVLRPR